MPQSGPLSPFIPLAELTAQGAILSASAASTVAIPTVGTDGQAVVAASGEASGLLATTMFATRFYDSGILGVAAGSLAITGIPGTGLALLLVVTGRGTTAAVSVDVGLSYNSDTTAANYLTANHVGGTTHTVGVGTGTAALNLAGATADASVEQSCYVHVFDYSGTTFRGISYALTAALRSAASRDALHRVHRWDNQAAITRIDLTPTAGNFDVGSRATLWTLAV